MTCALAQLANTLSCCFSIDAKFLGKQEKCQDGLKMFAIFICIGINVCVNSISHPLTAYFRRLICSVWCEDEREWGERAHERLTHAKAGYYLCCCSGQGSVCLGRGEVGDGGTDEGRSEEGRLSGGLRVSGFPVGRMIRIRQSRRGCRIDEERRTWE